MGNEIEKQLIEIVRLALQGKKKTIPVSEELVKLAHKHQVQNLLYVTTEVPQMEKQFLYSVAQSMAQEYAAKEILSAFDNSGLTIIPIKGICTKERYPDSILRTMGDVDLVCDMNQIKQIRQLMLQLGYTDFVEGRVHDSYKRSPFVSIEMHKTLVDGDSKYFEYYKDVLKRCRLRKNSNYIREMTLEDEYIFNIIHLLEHFLHGGIGIRFVVDIYVYEHVESYKGLKLNRSYVADELSKLGIEEFYHNLKDLAFVWFGTDEERTYTAKRSVLEKLGQYILSCGLFGNQKNRANLNAQQGKIRSLVYACFPGYSSMKSMFPWLKPVLLPYAWMLRGMKTIRFRRKNIKTVWKNSMSGVSSEGNELKKLYSEWGLKM